MFDFKQSNETKNNIEQCEKKYLEIFSTLKNRDNVQYSNFIKKSIYKQHKSIEIYKKQITLNIKNLEYINFTYPLVTIARENNVYVPTELYKLIKINDEITIWGIMNKEHKIIHLTILIKTSDGYLFSFGLIKKYNKSINNFFKSSNNNNNDALIQTPDHLFENKLIQQQNKPENKYVKLISKTIITPQIFDKLFNLFTTFKSTYSKTEIYFKIFNHTIFKTVDIIKNINNNNNLIKTIISDYTISEEKQKKKTIKEQTIQFIKKNERSKLFAFMVFNFNYEKKYFMLSSSRKTNKSVNCSSFVEKLLSDIISCTGSSIVTNPEWCHQKRSVISKPC